MIRFPSPGFLGSYDDLRQRCRQRQLGYPWNAGSRREFSFLITDNGNLFTTVVAGCNQTSAAGLLDQLHASALPLAAVIELRNGSTDEVLLAIVQLSGSIYLKILL